MRKRLVALVLGVVVALSACGGTTTTTTRTESASASTTGVSEATDPTSSDPGTSDQATSTTDATTTTTTDPSTLTDEQRAELMDIITVKTITATPCIDLVGDAGLGTVKFDIGALKKDTTQGGPRLYTDALSTPVPKELLEPEVNIPGIIKFLDEQSCVNPHFGVADLHRFAASTFMGVPLVEANPWLKPFAVDVEDLDEMAAKYVFLDLSDAEKKDPSVQNKVISANVDWQEMAAKLNTLRSRFAVFGIDMITSSQSYHLSGVSGVGSMPEIGFDPAPDVKPAIVFGVTLKNSCLQEKFGYNLEDQRPEAFPPKECTPPPVTTVPGTNPPTVTTAPPCNCPTTTTTAPPCNCPTTTTTAPPTTTTVVVTTTTDVCVRDEHGKCVPPPTVAPSSETTAPATTTTQPPNSPTTVSAGPGATNTSVPPTTSAPAATVPVTASPTTNPPPPSDG